MISVEHLTKCYGDFTAVSDLSFEIEEGHVYGFLGPNGAGKSTTMNIMTGCLSATDGHVKIGGFDIFDEPQKAKSLIGYLPEMPPLYVNETPVEYLKFVGEAKGLRGKELWAQIGKVIRQTRIEEVCEKQISKLSKGYKQRVGIAQALLGNPKVIILDEPTVGLDPIQIIEIRDLIRDLGKEHTVIFSSHILSEVQEICDKVIIIAHGNLVAFDDTDNLERSLLSSNGITIRAEAGEEEVDEILADCSLTDEWEILESVDEVTSFRVVMNETKADDICREIFFAFAKRGKAILEMSAKKANLEEIFLELTSGTAKGPEMSEEEEMIRAAEFAGMEENPQTMEFAAEENPQALEFAAEENPQAAEVPEDAEMFRAEEEEADE